MGLHISRIEIRNFRNFRHLVIDDFPAHGRFPVIVDTLIIGS
ncbi:hypothetical protein AB0H73_38380 [Streptomyces olivoreticuli]